MSALEEVARTIAVAFSPIWIACLIGAVCWAISYSTRRKEGRR